MIQDSSIYKEFYFREIDRKHELNKAVNIPIAVISVIISIYYYLFNQRLEDWVYSLGVLSSFIVFFLLFICIFYLFRSYSNLFKGHKYKEIANMNEVLSYEKKLNKLSKTPKKAKTKFEKYLKDELADCSAIGFEINKKRTEDIASAKKLLFVAFVFTVIFSVCHFLKTIF